MDNSVMFDRLVNVFRHCSLDYLPIFFGTTTLRDLIAIKWLIELGLIHVDNIKYNHLKEYVETSINNTPNEYFFGY